MPLSPETNSKISGAVGRLSKDYKSLDSRIGSHIGYAGDALAFGFKDAASNVLNTYDKNTARENDSVVRPQPPGINHAQKLAAANKDSGTLASTIGIKSYKKGGKVKKTAIYRLHKGERVLNPKQTKKFEKKGGMRALAGK